MLCCLRRKIKILAMGRGVALGVNATT